jgi:hypothetical protein
MKHYILQNLIAIDQVFNTILGGYADETLSARAWRAEQKGRFFGRMFRPAIDLVMFFQPEHCKLAHEAEMKRRHLPPEMRV